MSRTWRTFQVEEEGRNDDAFLTDKRAACRDHDPELWFSDAGSYAKEARDICTRCPATDDCAEYAEYAIARPWLQGVWGATTAGERDNIRRDRRGSGA